MATSDSSDTQGPVFWERLRGVLTREGSEESDRLDGERRDRVIAVTVCFLISCFLWAAFTLQDTHTIPIQIATAVQNDGGAQAFTSLPPPTVRAEIEGEGTELLRFYFQDPLIRIGSESEQVRVDDLVRAELPRGTRLQHVSPTVLTMEREPRLVRSVPVELRGTVRAPAPYDLMDSPRIEPDSIRISGARSLVAPIEAWPTVPVREVGLKDSLRRRVPLADTLDGLVTRSTGSVVLSAQAAQFTEGIRQADVRVTGGPDNAVTLDPSSIRVQYRTLVDDYQQAQETDAFYATVPYEKILNDTTGRVRPTIETPVGLTIRDVRTYPSALRYFNFVADEQ